LTVKKKNQNKLRTPGRDIVLWGLFFEKLMQNIEGLVIVTDGRGRTLFVNNRALDLFCFSKKDILNECWINKIIPESDRGHVSEIVDGIKNKKILTLFCSHVMVFGDREKYFSWTGVPLQGRHSTIFMFVGREEKAPAGRGVKVYPATPKMLNNMYKKVIETMFEAVRKSEPWTAKHAARVMLFAVALARKLKMSKEKIEKLKTASLFHDLGKLAVDENILFKKKKLEVKEFSEIKKHPYRGSEVVRLVYFLHDVIPIMANHHEHYDGSGYPNGVKGDDIPLEARVLSVADVYEALISDRPYRKGFCRKEAIDIMESEKGRRLDPKVTDIFLDMVRDRKLKGDNF